MLFSLLYFLVGRLLGAGGRRPEEKDIELLVLRHQVQVLQRQVKRPRLHRFDRVLLAVVSRAGWRNAHPWAMRMKLRKDQLAAKVDHSVVSTAVFPSGKHQVCQHDGVIIANPARVIAVVQILRKHLGHLVRLCLGRVVLST